MKIAVTGYRGFIASSLIPELKKEELTLIEQEDYPPKIGGATAIVHLGALAGARANLSPYDYFDLNVKKTVELLEAARKSNANRFIFISTCTVSHGIKNVYDISKLQAEQWCQLYRSYINDVTILRLYNVYGEGDNKSVIAKFVAAVQKDKPIVIHGSGNQKRDFIHVKDVTKSIRKTLYSKVSLNRAIGIGTGKEKSVNDLAHMIFQISGKKVPIQHAPLPYSQLRSAKCPRPLFVEKPISLEVGIKRLIQGNH